MSQIDVFMTDEETDALWVYLCRQHDVVAVPDRSKTRNFVELRSIQDLRSCRAAFSGSSQYHLSSTRWGPYLPLVSDVEAPGEYPFRLQPQYGGPHVIWTMSRLHE